MWNKEQYFKELSEVVNIDSGSNDFEGIGRVGEYFAEKLKAEGLIVSIYDKYKRVEARTHKDEQIDILLVGHMDTVFPKGTVQERQYAEKEGLAYGPGVADMKGGLVMILHLIRRIIRECPQLKVCVALNGDEETGSETSKDWLVKLAGLGKYAFVFEPGRLGNKYVRSRKGCVDCIVNFYGKAAHAGAAPEEGASATVEMARWITMLTSMQNLKKGTSINAGIVKGGTASNVIPDFAEVVFDIRFSIPEELEAIKKCVYRLKNDISTQGVTVKEKFSGVFMPMNPTNKTQVLMAKLEDIAEKKHVKMGWADTGGVSDANHIAVLGIPTICGCGPCGDKLHSEEEYMVISSVEERLDLMFSLLTRL